MGAGTLCGQGPGKVLEFHHKNSRSLKSLVAIGAEGLFPIFEKEWILEARKTTRKLTGNEKVKAKGLFKRIGEHDSLERKKIALAEMGDEERVLFVRAFMKMVEDRVLGLGKDLQ